MKHKILFTMVLAAICQTAAAQGPRRGFQREAFTTGTPMVHDPVMANASIGAFRAYFHLNGIEAGDLPSSDVKAFV